MLIAALAASSVHAADDYAARAADKRLTLTQPTDFAVVSGVDRNGHPRVAVIEFALS